MSCWTSDEAQGATQGKREGKSWIASGISIDSRTLKPGELFVALRGERFDGHDYLAQAFERGACAALVSSKAKAPKHASLLVVPDTLEGLRALAAQARKRSKARIVGVTGSVGKTSAKEMMTLALSALGSTFSSRGNFNNHIGAPLNLAHLTPDYDYAIFEMGMNHAGEIAPLSKLIRPHAALITTVEAVHLEFFGSVEAIADAKAEIFEGLEAGGCAILNADNPHLKRLREQAVRRGVQRILTFGTAEGSDVRLLEYHVEETGARHHLSIQGQPVELQLAAIGRHWGSIAAGVLATVLALEGDVAKAVQALAEFREVEGRGTRHQIAAGDGTALLVDDSYNASPASMRAAFEKLSSLHEARRARGRRIAALGDMLELGADAPALHAALAEDLKAQQIDAVFTAGVLMQHLYNILPSTMRGGHAENAAALLPMLQQTLSAGDTLLIKGSHGSKMYELARTLKEQQPAAKEIAHAV